MFVFEILLIYIFYLFQTNRFKGKRCEEEIFECDSKPCKNGGICFEKSNSTLIDELNASSNGSLNETIDSESYYCKCAPGFKGLNCEINIDDCLK